MPVVTILPQRSKSKYQELMATLYQGVGFINTGGFQHDLWEIRIPSHNDKRTVSLDFSIFDSDISSPKKNYDFDSNGEVITNKEMAKLYFLLSVRSFKNAKNYKNKLRFLHHMFIFLKSEDADVLNRHNLSLFLASLLRFKATEKGLIKVLSEPSSVVSIRALNLLELDNRVNATTAYSLLDMPEIKELRDIESKVVEEVLNVSLQDYIDGSSYNFLGLEIGRHYVDYCAEFFKNGFCYSYATNKAIDDKFVQDVALKFRSRGLLTRAEEDITILTKRVKSTAFALSCPFCYTKGKLSDSLVPRNSYSGIDKRMIIRELLIPRFEQYYTEGYKKSAPLNDALIREVIDGLKLTNTGYNLEFIRCLIAEYIYFSDDKSNSEVIVGNFVESIGEEKGFFNHSDFVSILEKNIAIISNMKFVEIVTSFHSDELNTNSGFDRMRFVKKVEYSAIVQISAISGWRASELLFPIEAISICTNDDLLDSTYLPYRFMVNWIVPKSNGNTKLQREVTPTFYILSQCLESLTKDKSLVVTGTHKPAIANQLLDISTMNYRVLACWQGFVKYYQIFQDLDLLDEIVTSDFTPTDILLTKKKFDIDYLDESKLLRYRTVRDKVRRELPYLYAAGILNIRKRGSIGNLMKYYQEGSLQTEIVEIWNERIPNELLNSISDFNFKDESEDNKHARGELTRACFRYLIDEVAYPTPHAFRHIFAEAVLLRYTTEVGSFIRSAFKHMNGSFFERYLRNKTSKTNNDLAKRVVLSRLVKEHLESIVNGKRAYAGKMDVFMRRIAKQVVKLQINNMEEFAHEFAEKELVDIKSNPWGFCILKRHSQHLAKCVEPISNSPMRHLAKPSLCLGCINGLQTSDHAEWIMINAQNAVEMTKQPLVPNVFKKDSERVIKNSIKVLQHLKNNERTNVYDDFLSHLESVKEEKEE
tara:strand:+ start:10823 stop:13612 length:2790 start_codon:yes stop_codon:yes gene_type:complete